VENCIKCDQTLENCECNIILKDKHKGFIKFTSMLLDKEFRRKLFDTSENDDLKDK
jgi:hypothetical protein